MLALLVLAGCSHTSTSALTDAEIRLNSSAAAAQLGEQLPMPLVFEDRMGGAQIARLPTGIVPDRTARPASYKAGDVAYWAPEQSIVVFLSGGTGVPADGLVLLGHITDGLDDLYGCGRNCAVVLRQSVGQGMESGQIHMARP